MYREASVTSLSWIPSEAVVGLAKLPFKTIAHYDQPPPDHIGGPGATIEELRLSDRFRFVNELRVFVEFADDGRPTRWGHLGGGHIGATTIALGGKGVTVAAVAFPDLQPEPEVGPDWVRFTQTAGGRTGVPAPRTVRRPPFVQYDAPTAWATLQITVHADGRVHRELTGASPFPRHWVYDDDGVLIAKSGVIEFKDWWKNAFGDQTPWGGLDSPALTTTVETALERELSVAIMRGGAKPDIRRYRPGDVLFNQGDAGGELFLVLDGVIAVEHDGVELGQLGPGTITGERAILEHGLRTATNRAVTAAKVAVVGAEAVDRDKLVDLTAGHRRELIGNPAVDAG
jgi:hypothetical protein